MIIHSKRRYQSNNEKIQHGINVGAHARTSYYYSTTTIMYGIIGMYVWMYVHTSYIRPHIRIPYHTELANESSMNKDRSLSFKCSEHSRMNSRMKLELGTLKWLVTITDQSLIKSSTNTIVETKICRRSAPDKGVSSIIPSRIFEAYLSTERLPILNFHGGRFYQWRFWVLALVQTMNTPLLFHSLISSFSTSYPPLYTNPCRYPMATSAPVHI